MKKSYEKPAVSKKEKLQDVSARSLTLSTIDGPGSMDAT